MGSFIGSGDVIKLLRLHQTHERLDKGLILFLSIGFTGFVVLMMTGFVIQTLNPNIPSFIAGTFGGVLVLLFCIVLVWGDWTESRKIRRQIDTEFGEIGRKTEYFLSK